MSQFNNGNFDDPFSGGSSGGFGGGSGSFGGGSDFSGGNHFSNAFDQTTYAGPPTRKRYGLHWLQTLFVFGFAIGACLLLKGTLDIRYAANPTLTPHLVPFNALFFGVLAAVILLTVFFVEVFTSAMTPHFSRKLQLLVVVIAVALCSLIGALTELFYVNYYVAPQLVPTPIPVATPTPGPTATPSPTPVPSNELIVFALDKSGSMSGDKDKQAVAALNTVIQKMSSTTKVGLIVFDDEILTTVPIAENTAAQRSKLSAAIATPISGLTDFPNVMDAALPMFSKVSIPANTDAKLVFVTDGSGGSVDKYVAQCKQMGIQVSCVLIGNIAMQDLNKIIKETGGMLVTAKNPTDILNVTQSIVLQNTPVPTPTPFLGTPTPTPIPKIGNMMYTTPDSDAYLAAALILFGLIIGVSVTLMLSLHGQLRLQLFLSPLTGLLVLLSIRNGWVAPDEYCMLFSLFGLLLMRRNSAYGSGSTPSRPAGNSQNAFPSSSGSDWTF
ncbi:MAG: VWA domain-containing protein [Clostridia bacterium]|nr:VWA domain-containing protein [Clostridia bacterium]